VPGIMNHPIRGLSVLVLMIGAALPTALRAQTRVNRPPLGTPTVIVGPRSLDIWRSAEAQVLLAWPAVAGADRYRLTRIENTGDPEVTIEELPASSFACEPRPGSSEPWCSYTDMTRLSKRTRPVGSTSNPYGSDYPHSVTSGKLYTYRAWALFPGPIVSPPSPPATVRVL
jgi:hypothetical protein